MEYLKSSFPDEVSRGHSRWPPLDVSTQWCKKKSCLSKINTVRLPPSFPLCFSLCPPQLSPSRYKASLPADNQTWKRLRCHRSAAETLPFARLMPGWPPPGSSPPSLLEFDSWLQLIQQEILLLFSLPSPWNEANGGHEEHMSVGRRCAAVTQLSGELNVILIWPSPAICILCFQIYSNFICWNTPSAAVFNSN